MHVFLVCARLCPDYVAICSLLNPTLIILPQNFSQGLHLSVGQNRTVGWMMEYRPTQCSLCLKWGQTCVRGRIAKKKQFCWIIEIDSAEPLNGFCQGIDVSLRMIVTPLSVTYTKISLLLFQQTAIMNFPAEGVVLKIFLRGDCELCQPIDCPFFVSGSKFCVHVSSPVVIFDRKLSQKESKSSNNLKEIISLF